MIKEEVQYLRVAMGHEDKSLDEFVEVHKTCMNDFMFFPKRNAYGASSIAGNEEKLEALQSEFENVKKKLDDDIQKAANLEKKVKVRTHGYEVCFCLVFFLLEEQFSFIVRQMPLDIFFYLHELCPLLCFKGKIRVMILAILSCFSVIIMTMQAQKSGK